jgi:hypothetical protein
MDDNGKFPLEITEELRAEAKRCGHVPDRDEIREMLVRYFIGPITEAHVNRLVHEFERPRSLGELEDLHWKFKSHFAWRGWAWNEEVSENHTSAAPIDLVLMMGHQLWDGQWLLGGPEFPQPKLYCPPIAVGTWQQVEPAHESPKPVIWQLNADGSYRTNSPDAPEDFKHWCVHRQYGRYENTFKLVFRSADFIGQWSVREIEATENEMAGLYLGPHDNTPFRFRRYVEGK